MILSNNGKYYLDKEEKHEFTSENFNQVMSEYTENSSLSFIKIYEGKEFTFDFTGDNVRITNKDKQETELSFNPVDITFKGEKKIETRKIYSLDQYEKTLNFFGIKYPWSQNMYLTESNKISLIHNPMRTVDHIDIEDLDIFNIDIKNESKEIKKLKDLSIYIKYYAKSEINLGNYPESKFLKEEDYILNPENEFVYYMKNKRSQIALGIENMCINKKEYFFTGNVSIGKTFILLYLCNMKRNDRRKAYYNLDILSKSKEYLKIILYESRRLFDTKKEWIEAFHKIEKEEIKTPLAMILSIIKGIDLAKKDKSYIFIIDQIKFEDINKDRMFKEMNEIRKYIKKTNNFYLIGCLSMNYKGIKQILFYNWFKTIKFEKDLELDIPLVYVLKLDFTDKEEKNIYLNLLGNLPRYKNIKDKLNIKIINILVRKIKEKIKKFYGYKDLLDLEKLENLKINEKIEKLYEFENLLDKIPFKYFNTDIENNKIDYSYPLVKIAISELLYSNKIKKYTGGNQSDYGWHIERRVIDKIKTSHQFGDYYIDYSYEIPTIYLKYKIDNELFQLEDNSFFYFSYFNVKRYDCAIYFGKEKSILLIQIATNRKKIDLLQYNTNNFQEDLISMYKFFNENNLIIHKYYFLFIITIENEKGNTHLEQKLNEYNFKYLVYDLGKDDFTEKSITKMEISTYKNPHLINIPEKKIFYFYLTNNTFFFGNYKNYTYKCYSQAGDSLIDFIEQIFDEELATNLINKYKFDKHQYHLKYVSSCIHGFLLLDMNFTSNTEILFLGYKENIVYIGTGMTNDSRCKLSFETYQLDYGERITKIMKIGLDMKGFVFQGNTRFINI